MSGKMIDTVKSEKRVLCLVGGIGDCESFLPQLIQSTGNNLVISCSLGPGQPELIQLLRVFSGWEKVLLFENSTHDDWAKLTVGDPSRRWHQVLVDRICWKLDKYGENGKFVRCHCESSAKFSWPREAGIPRLTYEKNKSDGLCLSCDSSNWHTELFSLDSENGEKNEEEWFHLRKRALVNGPHAIAALLCYRILAIREMEADKQFLAPLQNMLSKFPEWESAMDHYLRIRALEVAWKSPFNTGHEKEQLHSDYSEAYQIAKVAQKRFFTTNDRLDRLMNRLDKELSKFEEHILGPTAFYAREHKEIIRKWIYGRPNHVDLNRLRDFLTETFLIATRWLESEKRRKDGLVAR